MARSRIGTTATFIQRSRAVPASDKALYHNVEGAGKRRVIREFFALGPDDEDAILDRFAVGLERLLKESH